MSRVDRRTRLGRLSLVSDTAATVPRPEDRQPASTVGLPEGWFSDEVGYVSETADKARIRTLDLTKVDD